MDTKKNYAVITYFIGNDTGNGVAVEVVEHLGKLLTCTICDTPMGAIKEFESQVNTLCWNKCLTDCMKSYYRGSDNVCRDMFLYAEGDDGVKALQTRLAELGYLRANEADGIVGKITLGAILAFQLENGLDTDGIVGPMTKKILRMAR